MPEPPSGPMAGAEASPQAVAGAPFVAAAGAAAVRDPAGPEFAVDGVQPALAVRPSTEAEVAATLRAAEAQGLAVVVVGGRSAVGVGNCPARYDVALETTGLDGLVAFEPGDLTVTVGAGLRFAALQERLAEQKLFVPLDPPQAEQTTVGGVIARGRGGPRRAAYGTVRDWLIGCALVLADGTRIKGGGRVVKNVSGYDLPKLFAGSFGTLGCIVEATFKLRPLPAADGTLLVPCADFETALALGWRLQHAVNGLQAAVALDARSAGLIGLKGPTLALRAAGVERAVAVILEAARALAETTARPVASEGGFWQLLTDMEAPLNGEGVLLRCGLAPGKLPEAAAAVQDVAATARLWSYADTGLLFAEVERTAAETVAQLRQRLEEWGGSLTVERAPAALKATIDVWGDPPGGLAIMQRLKQSLDPRGTLSPGRFVGGI